MGPDTTNKFMVAVQGESICVLYPAGIQSMAKEDAANLAAYLQVLICDDALVQEYIAAIKNT